MTGLITLARQAANQPLGDSTTGNAGSGPILAFTTGAERPMVSGKKVVDSSQHGTPPREL